MSYGESVRVAAFQGPLLDVGIIEGLDLVRERVRECEEMGIDVLCCPEGFLGGLADYGDDPTRCAIMSDKLGCVLSSLTSDTVTTIIGFSELAANGKLYNSAAVCERGNVIGIYRKIHPAIRSSVYAAGAQTPVFRMDELRFGILICNDSNHPDLARAMRADGATLLCIPTNNGLPRNRASMRVNDDAKVCDVALAVENRCWVVRADVYGRNRDLMSFGSSEIVNPSGAVVQKGQSIGLLIAEIPAGELVSSSVQAAAE